MGYRLTAYIQALLFALALFLRGTHFAEAADATITNPIGANSFIELAETIATFARDIMTPIAAIVVLYAAVLFMTSGGDVEKVKKAKRALTWALVGIAIVLIGEGFIYIIEDALTVK